MKRKLSSAAWLAAFLAFSLVAGCGGDDGTDPGDENPIDLPLTVGNSWIYEETSTPKNAAVTSDTTTIIGTESLYGKTWYQFVGSSDRDTVRVRQDGQDLYLVPVFGGDSGDDDPPGAYIRRVVENSVPWKYADFDAPAGTEWTLAEGETTFVYTVGEEQFEAEVGVSFRARSNGRVTVSVPAGEFQEVYRGTVSQLIFFSSPEGTDSMTTERSLWIADGVGIVKTEEVSTNPAHVVETISQILQSYEIH